MLTITPNIRITDYNITNEYGKIIGKIVYELPMDKYVYIPLQSNYESNYYYREDTLKQINSMLENLNAKRV